MKFLRWFTGLVFIVLFVIFDFFIYDGEIYFKLINVILLCAIFILYRVFVGPSPADRIVAVDILGVLTVGMLALLGLHYDQSFLLDVGLIWALLSFIASLAFAKVLEGRSLDD